MLRTSLVLTLVLSLSLLIPGNNGDDEKLNALNMVKGNYPWGSLLPNTQPNTGSVMKQKWHFKFSHKKSTKSSFKTVKHTFHHSGKK